jgi:putative membrane protein
MARYAHRLLALGACVAWIACSKGDNTADTTAASASMASTPAVTPAPAAPALTDANIAALLDEANAADSAAGKMASTKGTAAGAKEFGRHMMADHHALRKAGQDLAKKLSLTPQAPAGDTLPASAQKSADDLNAMPKGAAWDKAYIDHEVAVHQGVLSLLNAAQGAAQNAELKDLITKAIPNIQSHLDMATSTQAKLAGAAPAAGSADSSKKKP